MRKTQGLLAGILLLGLLGYHQALLTQAQLPADSTTLADVSAAEPQLIDAGSVPVVGTFFMLSDFQRSSAPPPYPCNPFPDAGVYATDAEGVYIVDDSEAREGALQPAANADLATWDIWERVDTLVESIQAKRVERDESMALSRLNSESLLLEDELGGGLQYAMSYASNVLWLEIAGVSNSVNQVHLAVHGTVADAPYEVLSTDALGSTNEWVSEGLFLGLDGTTPVATAMATTTGQRFFRARSWQDSDGSGLPDWWQLQYFGDLGIDPYGDADGDGWNNLQEYQNGTHPSIFDTPPPPQNVVARLGTNGTDVVLTWESGGGPVACYSVRDGWSDDEIAPVSAGTFSYTDQPLNQYGDPYDYFYGEAYAEPEYVIRASRLYSNT